LQNAVLRRLIHIMLMKNNVHDSFYSVNA